MCPLPSRINYANYVYQLTWRWGTPGGWGNPLRWGSPPAHIISHFNLITFTPVIGGVTLSSGVKFCHENVSRWGNPPSPGRIRDISSKRTSDNKLQFKSPIRYTVAPRFQRQEGWKGSNSTRTEISVPGNIQKTFSDEREAKRIMKKEASSIFRFNARLRGGLLSVGGQLENAPLSCVVISQRKILDCKWEFCGASSFEELYRQLENHENHETWKVPKETVYLLPPLKASLQCLVDCS